MSLAIKQPGHVMSWLIKLLYFKKTASLTTSLTEKINIFLTIDQSSIGDHFNPNDPAPLYKRQLSHQFQHYIMTSIESAKRYSVFYYKITCKNESDKQYTLPPRVTGPRGSASPPQAGGLHFELALAVRAGNG